MIQPPKSLTATVHVRFNYNEKEACPVVQGETEMLAKVLDQAANLDPALQELLIKFAQHLKATQVRGKD